MTLVEVTMAIGIFSFCAIAVAGLIPLVLETAQDARETSVLARIHQSATRQIRSGDQGTATTWFFNREGLLLPNEDGADFRASVQNTISPANLDGATNQSLGIRIIEIRHLARDQVCLTRPVFLTGSSAQPSR